MTIKPVLDKMVVELPTRVSDTDKGFLVQLIKDHDKVTHSRVVAVGPGKVLDNGKDVPMQYSVGDVVYYPTECEKTSPKITHNGVEYLVILQEQVLCYRPHAE